MPIRVKFCGIQTHRDLAWAARAGADAVGCVLSPSKRQVTVGRALDLFESAPPSLACLAVLKQVNELTALKGSGLRDVTIQGGVSAVNSGAELPSRIVPVVYDHPEMSEEVDRIRCLIGDEVVVLIDGSSPGSGTPGNWSRIEPLARRGPVILAGGLTPENVGRAIAAVRPVAVDVSSGIEDASGQKDAQRMIDFVQAVRAAEKGLSSSFTSQPFPLHRRNRCKTY